MGCPQLWLKIKLHMHTETTQARGSATAKQQTNNSHNSPSFYLPKVKELSETQTTVCVCPQSIMSVRLKGLYKVCSGPVLTKPESQARKDGTDSMCQQTRANVM